MKWPILLMRTPSSIAEAQGNDIGMLFCAYLCVDLMGQSFARASKSSYAIGHSIGPSSPKARLSNSSGHSAQSRGSSKTNGYCFGCFKNFCTFPFSLSVTPHCCVPKSFPSKSKTRQSIMPCVTSEALLKPSN